MAFDILLGLQMLDNFCIEEKTFLFFFSRSIMFYIFVFKYPL